MKLTITIYFLVIFVFPVLSQNLKDENLTIKYIGNDKTANTDYHDGQMRPAVGTQNYQILRANRSHPEEAEGTGWTYNHAPMLAYWKGYFICEYLSTPMGEHSSPGVTLVTKSKNGIKWDKPHIIFPIYFTTGITDDGKLEVKDYHMHQRMGFHVAPNGRLLVMAHYGGNDGDGIGRVVREMYDDFTLGPIYFIRLNDKWEGDVNYPFYHESEDSEFIKACESFLSDKIKRIQWWEENYLAEDANEFYIPHEREKAFCFYTISDSLTIGLFKARKITWTKDGGKTWKEPFRAETLTYGGAKIWGQRLDNGQYAMVYNPTDNPNRHPLCVATSSDGLNFNNLAVVHGEVPLKRYWGIEKRPGPQYVRGIIEGNGNPPGNDLWVVYSVNKEDIWVSRIPVPIKRIVEGAVKDDFNEMETEGLVKNWNIYSPLWCPVKIVKRQGDSAKSLMLKDFDPYDYARATRAFSQAEKQKISFDLYIDSNPQSFHVDICNKTGDRLIQLSIDSKEIVNLNNGKEIIQNSTSLTSGRWFKVAIIYNTISSSYNVYIDNDTFVKDHKFSKEGIPERIEFRTGKYRLDRKILEYKSGDPGKPGWDEPNADVPVDESVIYIRTFSTELIK